MEKVTTDVLEINRELELEAEPENMTDFCDLIIELEWTKHCFLWMSKESSFMSWNLLLVRCGDC